MAQEYGAAQPIVDAVKGPINKARKFLGLGGDDENTSPPVSQNKVDPADVAKANESFRKQAEQDAAAKPVDAKAAVAKMHPQHVHQLVQDANSGKFGPDAQKAAKQAMQSSAGQQGQPATDQPGKTTKPNYADMFSANGPVDNDSDQAVPAGQMFSGR